jgi:hypothetical protein
MLATSSAMHSKRRRIATALASGALAAAILSLPGCSKPERELKVFEDVTAASGIGGYTGMTHGAAWGDFDGDGLPDLYVTNHLNDAKLFRNLGKGRFADVTRDYFAPKDLGGDKHGAAWADFDNDGRLDLIQLTGAVQGVGTEPKHLFHNLGTKFEEVAEAEGVANPQGRTRQPLWVDIDRDGRLDLIEGAEPRLDNLAPPIVFEQRGDHFVVASDALKFASTGVPFCILTELRDDAHLDVVCRVLSGQFSGSAKSLTAQIFDVSTTPAQELDLLPVTAFEDIVAGDFDNDGAIDIFLARKNPPGMVAFGRPNEKEIVGDVWIEDADLAKPAGFTFKSAGKLSVKLGTEYFPGPLTPRHVHIGKAGSSPSELTFTLSPEAADVAGMAAYQQGEKPGIYIGFTAPDKWQVSISGGRTEAGTKAKPQQVAFKIVSSAPISEVQAVGDSLKGEEAPQRLFMNRGGKLVEEADKRGVNKKPIAAVNVVAGDFNNDMYLDLFIVGSSDLGKQENLLLLNRGDGTFDVVAGAGGADGLHAGVGDSVTTVDFDGDGSLDLLVTTGGSMGRSMGIPSEAGSYHLYRNILHNGNHWLEMDLEGTTSNRDAIGARVRVTAGGVTQVRIQDGGVHHRGQNHSRLHFGLAKNTRVDKISIQWPSGTVQELTGVNADQILKIKEPSK